MFFRRPLFYLAPDAEGGAAADVADDDGGISDADVAAAGSAEVGADDSGADDTAVDTAASPDADSLAGRVADLAESWKQHGITDLPNDPQQLRTQYLAGLQAQRDADTYKNQLLWNLHQQSQVQRPAPQPAPPPAKVFNLPEFDPQWLSMVYTNEAGELVAKPGAQPDLPMKIQAFAKAREEANIKLLQDPVGVLSQHFMPIIQQQAQAIAQQNLQEYARIREINQFEQQNAGWIFNNGVDNSAGLTPAANYFNQHYFQALQNRDPNPVQYAQDKIDAMAYRISLQEQTQQGVQGAAVTTARQADQSFLKRAAAGAGRGGSLPSKTTAKPPQNPKDLWGTLAKRLKQLPEGELEKN